MNKAVAWVVKRFNDAGLEPEGSTHFLKRGIYTKGQVFRRMALS
ncbi:hypothetical protein [Legionella waltersii]|nr:hypothetical protein [Legionella waltersii]